MASGYSRRAVLHYGSFLSVGGTSLLAGCSSEPKPAGGDGFLEGQIVTAVPSDANVVAAIDGRIADGRLLQSFIQNVVRSEEATQELSEKQVNGVSESLSQLSRYEPTHKTDAPHGYYIKQNQTVVVIRLIIRQ